MIFFRNIISLLIIGMAVMAMSYQSVFLAENHRAIYDFYIIAFCLTVFAYNYNKKEKELLIISYLSLGCAISISVLSGLYLNVNLLLLIFLTSFYFLIPAKFSIRNLIYFKPVFISIVWSLMTVKLPIDIGQGIFINVEPFKVILMSLERFFFIFALAVAYDIIDLRNDLKTGLDTIPGKHGINFSLILIIVALGIAASASVLSYEFTYYSLQSLSGLLFSFFASGIILAKIIYTTNHNSQKIIIDSLMILQMISVAISNSISL